jgi:photosystem II stability/assembly factor-like uncharacterized protein
MTSYYSIITSKMRKSLCLIVCLLCVYNSLYSQFQWEHTGGPEGFSNGELYYNKDFAFLYDGFQLFRTSDGQFWEEINSTLAGNIIVTDHRISIFSEQNKGIHNPKEIQLLLSDDNGDTWYDATIPQDAYFNHNQIMPCSHGIYFKAGEKLYRSQAGGQSWKQVSFEGMNFSSLFTKNDKIFGRNFNKIYEFNPQTSKWIFSWNMPVNAEIENIFINGSYIILYAGNKFYSSANNGGVWTAFTGTSNANGFLIGKDNKVFYHSGQFMRFTEIGGNSWTSFNLDMQYQKIGLIKDKFILFSSKVGCVLFDETSNSYLPANQGLTSLPIQSLWTGQNQIWALSKSDYTLHKYEPISGQWSLLESPKPTEPDIPFLISPSGNILYNNLNSENILISTDRGITWDNLLIPFSRLSDLESIFWIDDIIYVSGDSNYYISSDFGLTWAAISKHLTSAIIFRDQVWASDHSGKLVVSNDNALSWTDVDTEWENITAVHRSEDRIFVVNEAGYPALFSSVDGVSWEYSGDGINLNRSGFRIPYRKFWKQNDTYFYQRELLGLYYSADNCSSWERVNFSTSGNAVTVLNDTLYFSRSSGGGVIKSKMPRFDKANARGSIFKDLNGNGMKDPNENYLNEVQIMVSTASDPQKNYFTVSNQEGQFEIRPGLSSNDLLRPNILSEYVESIEPPFYIIHDSIENYDFAVRYRPNITDADINGKFNIQPGAGKELTTYITYQNKGTIPISGSVGLKLDPKFTLINAVPPPSEIVSADSIVWHFEDLPIFSKNQILVEGRLSSNLNDGALISMAASILPSNADIAMADNHFIIQDSIVNAFIPNQKSVFPAEGMNAEDILKGKELEYTIRFQNPYDHVVNSVQISDALSTFLDYTSIRITGSSHDISSWELLPSGILRVFFDNLSLAPKSNEDQRSQGFLSFAVRIRSDNNSNFNFANRANIIFEKTRAITTNDVNTKMLEEVISSTEEIKIETLRKLNITPNPASNAFTLNTNGNLKGAGFVRVFHPNGRILYTQKVQDLSLDIELQTNQLLNGFYLITAEGAEGIMHGKLIVQR